MNTHRKNSVILFLIVGSFYLFSVFCYKTESKDYSTSERRTLAQMPAFTWESFFSGTFAAAFEDYAADQFPLRDTFRKTKAAISKYIFGQKDYNGFYTVGKQICSIEYPMNETSIQRAGDRFAAIYEQYLKNTDTHVYASLIPDKNYFLAEQQGFLSMDYALFEKNFIEACSEMEYISIFPCLSIENYYTTDPHWKQETLFDTANILCKSMGNALQQEYTIHTLDIPFSGVYAAQSAFQTEPEPFSYIDADYFKQCAIINHETETEMEFYDYEKAAGEDSYAFFLSGSLSLITMENPSATTEKELILFRDSYGSSIAPFFLEIYQKVTLIDIRYLSSANLKQFVTFDNQDVLFLYSTLIINHSETLK